MQCLNTCTHQNKDCHAPMAGHHVWQDRDDSESYCNTDTHTKTNHTMTRSLGQHKKIVQLESIVFFKKYFFFIASIHSPETVI